MVGVCCNILSYVALSSWTGFSGSSSSCTPLILTKEFGWASIFSGSVWTSYVAWSCSGCALWSWVGDVLRNHARIPAGTGILVLCHRAVRSSHPRPSHCVGTGVPWVSLPGPTSVPSGAQAGWHRGQSANTVLCLCLCCVVVARAFDNLELWSCDYRC